jgi:hypothetical protein
MHVSSSTVREQLYRVWQVAAAVQTVERLYMTMHLAVPVFKSAASKQTARNTPMKHGVTHTVRPQGGYFRLHPRF